MKPVAVQPVKSYCLPLLVYCVRALRLTSSAIRQLSVCWNDAFRKKFHFKILKSIGGKCVYWSKFVCMLNVQFHICDDLFDKYVVKTGFNCSFKACVREHCRYM